MKSLQTIARFFTLLFVISNFAFAKPSDPSPSTLQKIASQIEARRENWTLLKAKIMLHFFQEDEVRASCYGQLVYDRIEERIVLNCVGRQNKLLFVFKTFDRQFELYLPGTETVYEGNIFALNDSPDIDSHLKPLDLYRALKPITIPLEEASVESMNEDYTGVKIYSKRHDKPYVMRKLVVNREGDVPFEIYYSENETPLTVIRRLNYQKIKTPGLGPKEEIVFPKTIEIESVPSKNKTVMFVKKVEFPAEVLNQKWKTDYPEKIKRKVVEDTALKTST